MRSSLAENSGPEPEANTLIEAVLLLMRFPQEQVHSSPPKKIWHMGNRYYFGDNYGTVRWVTKHVLNNPHSQKAVPGHIKHAQWCNFSTLRLLHKIQKESNHILSAEYGQVLCKSIQFCATETIKKMLIFTYEECIQFYLHPDLDLFSVLEVSAKYEMTGIPYDSILYWMCSSLPRHYLS